VRRDVRRFVFYRWRLLECPNGVPVSLVRAWNGLYGFLPPFGLGAVSGWHFRLPDGGRGVRIERPDRLSVPDPIRARLLSVIGAKHRVEEVRLAESAETPDLTRPNRLPRRGDLAQVEEWPTDTIVSEPLVAEFALSQGAYLADSHIHIPTSTYDALERALTFSDPDEAEVYLETLSPRPVVLLRYLAAARAETDLREAQQVDGKETV
jgi:hypothetical protein